MIRYLLPLGAALLLGACGPSSENRSDSSENEDKTASSTDCYDEAGPDFTQPKSKRAVFVIVDQSTGLDEHLRETLTENVTGLLEPGTTYAIYTFSAYSKGHYPTPVVSGELSAPVPEKQRADLSVRRLHRLDQCLALQQKKARSEVEDALEEATGDASSDFANSEIMASLKQISEAVRDAKPKRKLVIVASDLLEHSSSTSFYRNKQVRSVDVQSELQKAADNGLVADFGGANVAVIGAGLLAPEAEDKATRDTAALDSLHRFWDNWFKASDAEVVEYGQPDLVTPLTWDGSKS